MTVSPVFLADDPARSSAAAGTGDEPSTARPTAASGVTPVEPPAASSYMRSQFLRRVAHDIASPSGVALTVLDELASGDHPRPELLAMARRSLRRLMRLSEQLALVAELEGGGLLPERVVTDLRTLARRALDEALAIDGRRDVVAACALLDAPAPIEADGRLLLGVLREIVGNALRIASSRVEVSLEIADGAATMRVEDDGPGFSEDAVATLGQRFVPRASSRGLGLSLSVALDILRAHHGSLRVEQSRLPPGRRGSLGAAVLVTLPLATE